jgi:transposase
MLYSLIESAKLVGIEPKAYLRHATLAGLRDESVPLPHELVDSAAE